MSSLIILTTKIIWQLILDALKIICDGSTLEEIIHKPKPVNYEIKKMFYTQIVIFHKQIGIK